MDPRDEPPLLATERTSRRDRHYLSPEVAGMLRAARHRQGRTAREVALKAGISETHVCNLERGRRAPSQAVARALWVTLDLTLDEAELLVAESVAGVGWSR